jgi:hypothetical protein
MHQKDIFLDKLKQPVTSQASSNILPMASITADLLGQTKAIMEVGQVERIQAASNIHKQPAT